jgi:hypothetical protein
MNAQALTMGSTGTMQKVLSVSAIVYRFTMVLFMFMCMIFFYKTYKYNVGMFHMQKILNARFSVEDNYNGALVNIEYTDENILKESKMDHPKLIADSDFGMFAFNFIERVCNVQADTYIYETGTDKLLQIVPANNNIFQRAIVATKQWYAPKNVSLFQLAQSVSMKEATIEQGKRMYAWYMQQKLKKEREDAIKNNQLIEEEDQIQSNSFTPNSSDNDFKITDSRNLKIGGGIDEGLK